MVYADSNTPPKDGCHRESPARKLAPVLALPQRKPGVASFIDFMAKPKKLTLEEQVTLEFATQARAAGCPDDQWMNFCRAGVWLQPKQLRFAALARLCDAPDGPKQIMAAGGRGSAKSHGILAVIFL
jgi:uncharacterized protein YbjT (DUF2867 family)